LGFVGLGAAPHPLDRRVPLRGPGMTGEDAALDDEEVTRVGNGAKKGGLRE
jgi:hypothetical protein